MRLQPLKTCLSIGKSVDGFLGGIGMNPVLLCAKTFGCHENLTKVLFDRRRIFLEKAALGAFVV